MIRILSLLWLAFFTQSSAPPNDTPSSDRKPLEKGAYFAFVDHDYIFTIEVVKPGVLLLNFVSMAEREAKLVARDIRIGMENRKTAAKLLSVETGDFNQPMRVGWLNIRPRSSFGVRILGDFGEAKEISSATVRLEDEDLQLAPLSNYDFEYLALRINRINLGSPDFSEDWRVLRFQQLGTRVRVRKSNRRF